MKKSVLILCAVFLFSAAALAGWHVAAAIVLPMFVYGVSHGMIQSPARGVSKKQLRQKPCRKIGLSSPHCRHWYFKKRILSRRSSSWFT